MSDATLLPDGRIFLCNGAAVGKVLHVYHCARSARIKL